MFDVTSVPFNRDCVYVPSIVFGRVYVKFMTLNFDRHLGG